MGRKSGLYGQLYCQAVDSGALFPIEAATDSGDHRTFTLANRPISDVPPPVVRINGVLAGLEVSVDPNGANNTIAYSAGSAYMAGLSLTVAAGTVGSLTRPAATPNVVINSIVMSSLGVVTKLAGTEGAPGGARGAAGGPPFIPVGSILLADVTLAGTSAAAVVAVEIDNAGKERADIPGTTPDYFNGKIVCSLALPTIHTGSVVRGMYVTYRTASMQLIADITKWDVDTKKGSANLSGANDEWETSVALTKSWSASVEGYVTSPYWFDRFNQQGLVLIRLRHHKDDQYEWEGLAHVTGWKPSNPVTGAVTESITLMGSGPLTRRATGN